VSKEKKMKKNATLIAIFSTIILSFSSAVAGNNPIEDYKKAKDLDPNNTGICPGIYVCWDQNNDGDEECKCIPKPENW
jgi:hypothetical protein